MTNLVKRCLSMVLLGFLVACGGGGGAGSTPFGGTGGSGTGGGTSTGSGTGTPAAEPTIVLSISSTTVRSGTPATVTATARTASGAAAAGVVITFSTTGSLGSFTPASALTDANGRASVALSPASPSANGADLVVGSATIATRPVTGTIGFQVSPTTPPSTGSPSISVALSSNTVSTATPATLTATVRDGAGVGVAGQVVRFSTVDRLGTFNVPSALTDASGVASARISPATTSTAGADLAVAQVTVNGTLLTGSIGFSVTSTNAPVVGTPSISLSLSTTVVTSSTPAAVTATVRDATGAGVAGQVVRFRTVDGLGSFVVNSALTNASGVASVTLTATTAGASGADQVIAETTVNGSPLQAAQGFQLTAPNVAVSGFSADLGAGRLSAYGQTNLTVTVSGSTAGSPVQLAVSSACVAKGKASLTPANVTTTTGSATFTYRDNGCGATDINDALQASVVGSSASSNLALPLTSPAVASINFVSASPSTIFLRGSGLTETATVVFRVLDTAGNGLPNQRVRLEPTTLSGGLTVEGGGAPVTKLSDSLGNVTALVNSGTVPTPVRVKATLVDSAISTVSSSLSISVGLPSQLNFSLSQQTINIEGFDIDGTPNTYSIIASDRLANPVPAGTAINFVAEAGQIEANKLTALNSGLARASANFVSAAPRPSDGRVTVVAYALGEESFLDTNGNNVFDAGEDFQDLGNIYLNRRFNGLFDPAIDQFIALSLPGAGTGTACAASASQLLAGSVSIPSVPASCDGVWGRAYVRRAIETVFSRSTARPLWNAAPPGQLFASGGTCSRVNLGIGYNGNTLLTSNFYVFGANQLFSQPRSGVLSFLVADANNERLNPMPAGSTITVSATTGLGVTVAGGSPVPSTSSASFATLNYTFDDVTTSGTITVTIRSPSGVATSVAQSLSTAAPPGGAVNCP